jgi:hypothetical protein
VNVKDRKPIRVLAVSILVIVLYFALFPYPLGKELVAKPAWALDIASAAAGGLPVRGTSAGSDAAAPFRLGEFFGYVSGDGRLLYMDRLLFQVALTDKGFINFPRIGSTWIFQDIAGNREFAFSGTGYPLLSQDAGRLFTVKTDITGINALDNSGDVLWTRDFPCLMTSVSISADVILVGLLNGDLQIVDARGVMTAQGAPGGSRIAIILGCAASRDGRRIAAVSGIDPQFLTVFGLEGASLRQLSQVRLSSDFRREVPISFSPEAKYIVFQGVDGAELYEPESRARAGYHFSGGLSCYAFLGQGTLAILGGGESNRELLVVKPFASPLSKERFRASGVSLAAIGNGFLLGIEGSLLRIDLREM